MPAPPFRGLASPSLRRRTRSPQRSALSRASPSPLQPGALRLLLVANVIPRKNLGAVLRSLAALRREQRVSSWRLCVAGSLLADPAYTSTLRRSAASLGISHDVEWLGVLDEQGLAKLYRSSDLFVLTSTFENYCMAAHEAAFFGVPILAYATGETPSYACEL